MEPPVISGSFNATGNFISKDTNDVIRGIQKSNWWTRLMNKLGKNIKISILVGDKTQDAFVSTEVVSKKIQEVFEHSLRETSSPNTPGHVELETRPKVSKQSDDQKTSPISTVFVRAIQEERRILSDIQGTPPKTIQEDLHPITYRAYGKKYLQQNDLQNAEIYFRKAAELGDTESKALLGKTYFDNSRMLFQSDSEKDLQKAKEAEQLAVSWLEKSVKEGSSLGKAYLGYMYMYGIGVKQSREKGKDLIDDSAQEGNAIGSEYSIFFSWGGHNHVGKDNKIKFTEYLDLTKTPNANRPFSLVQLGLMYKAGKHPKGPAPDPEQAYACFKKAKELGDLRGQALLCEMTLEELKKAVPQPPDYAEKLAGSKKELQELSLRGDGYSSALIGKYFSSTFEEKEQWFLKSMRDKTTTYGTALLAELYLTKAIKERDFKAEKLQKILDENFVMNCNRHSDGFDYGLMIHEKMLLRRQVDRKGNENSVGCLLSEYRENFEPTSLAMIGRLLLENRSEWLNQKNAEGRLNAKKFAQEQCKISSDRGNPYGQAVFGRMHLQGFGGLKKDETEAVRLFQLSADQEDPYGQALFGRMYLEGKGGLEKNEAKALELFQLSADQNDSYGQALLGLMHLQGLGGLEKNEKKALELFQLSADQDDSYGQALLGLMHLQGLGGLEKNEKKAKEFLQRSADLEDPEGLYLLGTLYSRSKGIWESRKAKKFFDRATENGHPQTQIPSLLLPSL